MQLRILRLLFAGDLVEGEALAKQLVKSLGPGEEGELARSLILLSVLQHASGNLEACARTLEDARPLIDRLGFRGFHVAELVSTGLLQRETGKLIEPAKLFQRSIAIGDDWNDLPLQNSHHKLAEIFYEWNRLDEAREHADITERLIRQTGAKFHQASVCLLRARLAAVSGQWDLAFDEIELAIKSASLSGYTGIIPFLEKFKCRIWLATEQLSLAQGWLQHIGEEILRTTNYQDLPSALTGMRVRLHEGRGNETLEPLIRLDELASMRSWKRILLTTQILRAIVELEAGNEQRAKESIDNALQLGRDEGFIRSFLDEGSMVLPVLRLAALAQGRNQAYAASLLKAAGTQVFTEPQLPGNVPSILSPRERDVMRLVAAGLSNREVADALFISEETIKTHLRRIFDKLGVSSRTQAILRCQQLELL